MPDHECDIFRSESGAFYVRCLTCRWWCRKLTKTLAAAAAEGHERQGSLALGTALHTFL